MTKAILLSGGLDSIALAWWRRPSLAITIDYGQQPAMAEIEASTAVAGVLGIPHNIVRVDCRALGSGDMAGRSPLACAPVSEWWPFRNQLLITLAAMHVADQGMTALLMGSVATDGAHADGRRDFFDTIDQLLALQEGGLRVEAPALGLTTADLVRMAGVPREVLGWAHSCHVSNLACGACRGCVKHYNVTKELYGDAF